MRFVHPDYTIVRELGHGGSATVFLAVQNKLNRRVALKVLHGALTADTRLGERFLREARLVAKLNHPHIVPVHDVGEAPDGGYFMAMEYLSGGTLKEHLSDLTLGDTLTVLQQITEALGYAHAHDVVHRDVKPDNIIFRAPGQALLADFGIARTTQSLTHMTLTGTLLGTPDYMSPEQVGGGDVDARSDLYSLGVVLYEVLTGHRPFSGDSVMSIGLAHITTQPPPLPPATQGFQPCLDRALAKRPEERYQSAEAFRTALAELKRKPPVALETPLAELHSDPAARQSPLSTLSEFPRRPRRRPWAVPVGLLMAVLVAGGGWWLAAPEPEPGQLGPPGAARSSAETPAPVPEPSELERALATAEEAFRLDRWFGPEPDQAVNAFRAALRLDPGNDAAETRLDAIFDTTFARAEDAVAAGALDRADGYLRQLGNAWPDDARLPPLVERLDQERERLAARADAAERQRRIEALLARAGAAAGDGRWVGSAEDDATTYYRQVLALAPEHPLARTGLATVTETLLNQAERSMAAEEFDTASARLEEARAVLPDHPRVASVSAALAEQRRAHLAREDRRAEARLLANAVSDLTGRVNAWLADEEAALDADYETLRADLAALLERAPDHPELKSLEAATVRQADMLARAEERPAESEDDADDDVFRVPSF